MHSISLLTPTCARDIELCALLCESVDRHLTSYVKHYLIVTDDELPMFRRFNGSRRVVVPSSQVLPPWLKPLPRFAKRNNRRYWWSLRSRPVSGWHVQQLLKIAGATSFAEERYCILDSDIVFFRNFDLSTLLRPNPAPLFGLANAIAATARCHPRWVRSSHRLLGLGEPTFPATDFIGPIIVWDRQTVRAMIQRIEQVTGCDWVEALCRAHDFSEYMLYGTFVGSSPRHMADHRATAHRQCISYRGTQALDRPAMERMLSAADDGCIALPATLLSGTPIEVIRSSLALDAGTQARVA